MTLSLTDVVGSMLHRGVRASSRFFRGRFGTYDSTISVEPDKGEVETGEIRLAYLQWPGEGRPIILLHGLDNTAWIWSRAAELLASRRPVIAVTLRGHGRSGTPPSGYSLEDTTRDLSAVLDRLAPGPVDLAGHSWGGKVSCHMAASAPARVRSLILADPVPPAGLNTLLRAFPLIVRAAFSPDRRSYPDRRSMEEAAGATTYLRFGDGLDRRVWREKFMEREDGRWRPRLSAPVFDEILRGPIEEDIRPLMSRIRCPVLLLRPTLTLSFWPGEFGSLRRGRTDLVEKRVPGDHAFIYSNAMDTAREMAEFLDMRRSRE